MSIEALNREVECLEQIKQRAKGYESQKFVPPCQAHRANRLNASKLGISVVIEFSIRG
jgi:hypothetical protein